jgi:hypothetical protein
MDPENTTPGIIVAGAICAALHPGFQAQAGLGTGVFQALFPVAIPNANMSPVSAELPRPKMSDSGTLTL